MVRLHHDQADSFIDREAAAVVWFPRCEDMNLALAWNSFVVSIHVARYIFVAYLYIPLCLGA